MITLNELKHRLRELDDRGSENAWPQASLDVLSQARCWQRTVPNPRSSIKRTPREVLEIFEAVAWGSLPAVLILTQHVAAAELLAAGDNHELSGQVLQTLHNGDQLATVGISQLTTSRRQGTALTARRTPKGFRLDGVMPWVTSAAKADVIVTGAVLDDAAQILACLAGDVEGLVIEPPMDLAGLRASWTSAVRCAAVQIGPRQLLRGPAADVLARRSPVKPLTVSAVGLGVAGSLLDHIDEECQSQPHCAEIVTGRIQPRYHTVRAQLLDAADRLDSPDAEIPATHIRAEVNDLVGRLALTLATVAKGSGYVRPHVAQRRVREAMFLLVWSAPANVQSGFLRRLWSVTGRPSDADPLLDNPPVEGENSCEG